MTIRNTVLGTLLLYPLAICSVGAVPVTYYDINFSSPTHTVGSAPTVGSGIDTPSSIVFGQPTVESSLGGLTDQALIFNTTGNSTTCCFYDQIELQMGFGSSHYQVSFDFSSENFVNTESGNTFTVLFDTPQVRNVYFNNSGSISYFNPGAGSGTIGSFADNQMLNMLIDIDLVSSVWEIFANGSLLFSGMFTPSGDDIESIRFSFGGIDTTTHDSVGIDNILVTNGETMAVPEPSSLLMLSLGLLGLLVFHRKWRGRFPENDNALYC